MTRSKILFGDGQHPEEPEVRDHHANSDPYWRGVGWFYLILFGGATLFWPSLFFGIALEDTLARYNAGRWMNATLLVIVGVIVPTVACLWAFIQGVQCARKHGIGALGWSAAPDA